MKFVKRITIFFIIPMIMFAGGFISGTAAMDFFYPGRAATRPEVWAGAAGTDTRTGEDGVWSESRTGKDGMLVGVQTGEVGMWSEAQTGGDGIGSDNRSGSDGIAADIWVRDNEAGADIQARGNEAEADVRTDGNDTGVDIRTYGNEVGADIRTRGNKIGANGGKIAPNTRGNGNGTETVASGGVSGNEAASNERAGSGKMASDIGTGGNGTTGNAGEDGTIAGESVTNRENPAAVEVSLNGTTVINADTVYVIQEYSRNTGETAEKIISLPETFLGMSRELFTKTMTEFSTYPSLSEQEKGFVGCEVVSFSPQRVVVRKTYELPEELEYPPGYYLVNENNYVTVYLGDRETVYMNTTILLQRLPEELQREIIYIKYVAEENELYGFLETYSS